jgi:hypothetical protein
MATLLHLTRWWPAAKMLDFFMSLDRSSSIVKRYICAKGDACSICSFITIHFVTSRYSYRHAMNLRKSHTALAFKMAELSVTEYDIFKFFYTPSTFWTGNGNEDGGIFYPPWCPWFVIAKEICEGLPWEVLYADDLVLIATSMEELKDTRKFRSWI